MPFKWSLTPSIRDKILKRTGVKGVWTRNLAITVMLVTLSLVCILVLLRLSTKYLEEDINRSLQHGVEQRQINIDFRLRSMQQLDENLISMIYPYTHSDAGLSEQFTEYTELNAILSTYTAHEDIANVRLYLPDVKIYSHQADTYYPLSALKDVPGVKNPAYFRQIGIQWLETHLAALSKSPRGNPEYAEVLTITHTIRHRSDYDALACVLMLDIEASKFDEIIAADDAMDCTGYLVNAGGICLASPDHSLIRQTVIEPELMERMRKDTSGSLSDAGRIYVFRKLDYNDWFVVMNYPADILSVSNSTQGNAMYVLITVMLIISLTLVFILAYNYTISATVSRINSTLDVLNTGDNGIPEEIPQLPNPLHQLERNADQIVLTVKDLMESKYRDQITIAESQMKSLQAQIKPHFLYNTLDIIKWMILDQKNDEAAQMVNTLSKYLRQSINKGPGIIPLKDELELSRNYVSIMQTRFKNRFTVHYEIEDTVLEYPIPKLSLQPLLENALLHGLVYCEKPDKELSVRAWVADGSVHIEIEDNGSGMNEDTLRALKDGTIGYGLSNVRKRLAIFSKGAGAFEIFSREGFGTCIAISIPAGISEAPPNTP